MRRAIFLCALMILVVFSPGVFGVDTDGDGIDDSSDKCKWAAGTANSTLGMGCPDSDGDGLADFEEAVKHNWDDSEWEMLDETSISNEPFGMEWASNGSYFYSGGEDNLVLMYDSLGNNLGTLHEMPGAIREIQRSPDGTMLAIASDNAGAHVINSTTGALIVNLTAPIDTPFDLENDTVCSVAWSNDQSRIFFHDGGDAIVWFTTNNWTKERMISGFPTYYDSSWMGAIDTTPDDSLVVFSALSGIYSLWVENGTTAWSNTSHTDYVRALRISPDGRYMVSGGDMGMVVIHKIEEDNAIWETDIPISVGGTDIYDIDISHDSGTVFVASRSGSLRIYDTDDWSSLGEIDGFGSQNNNRGSESVAVSPDGERIIVGHRRGGRISLHIVADGHLRVHGEFATQLMESRWRDSFPTSTVSVRTWNVNRELTTSQICDGAAYVGSHPAGVSPLYADKNVSFSETGLWDCKNTDSNLLEVPYGRMAGAMIVKSGGVTETCINSQGGLSMGQLRWIVSGASRSSLQQNGEMPGLNMASIAPNDDLDNIPEWSDLDSSCDDSPIVLAHRWENRTEPWILKDKLLCANCNNQDSFYGITSDRFRAIVGEERMDVITGVSGSSGEGSIGFTELAFALENQTGISLVSIVDNYTHGAADAISNGDSAINPGINESRDDIWPLQTDQRLFINTEHLNETINFAKYLLSDLGAIQWEDIGFTRLGLWSTYVSYGLLGVNVSYILPDSDSDGVWDGSDLCPDTDAGLSVNIDGCADNQLDDDLDGLTNDLDDCPNLWGNSSLDRVGCPDLDGDGYSDLNDRFPLDNGEWNDTDSDGFGDNSDDCIASWGNSTIDNMGCPDLDGDGWSDDNDAFVNDSSEWSDTDNDGYGDNSDVFPYEYSQWNDTDGDGFGDNLLGLEGDNCPNTWGESYKNGNFGCIDSDGDGWADTDDDLPNDPLQYIDDDGDGIGDSYSVTENYDECPDTPGNETQLVDQSGCSPSQRDSDLDSIYDNVDDCPNTPYEYVAKVNTMGATNGCAPQEIDADNDGWSLAVDWDDNDPNQYSDTDGDGYGDNGNVPGGDSCPTEEGTSYQDKLGCPDLDADGWSNDGDALPFDDTQWADTDGDGFYDNWDDPSWNESRTVGIFVLGATNPDRCPEIYSNFADYQGCLTAKIDESNLNQASNNEDDEGLSWLTIIGMIAGGIILALVGAIMVLVNKKKKPKKKEVVDLSSDVVNSADISIEEIDSDDSKPASVSNWEDLPPGEWLPTDENGTNWYQDSDGNYWYSDSDGYHIWDS